MVTRHSAVVGSTGSGKSTTVSSIVQSISDPSRFPSARIVLFDMHGEYARALGASANVFTIDATRVSGAHELSVPFWALTFDELVPLLFGSIADDAGRAYVRDLTTELKRASFKRKSVAGLNKAEINADSPVPFSVRTLWFELHVLLNATHTAAGGQSQATWALLEDAAGNPIEPGDSERVVAPIFQTQTQSAGAAKVYLSTSPLNIRRAVDVLGSRLRDRRFDFALSPSVWSPSKKGKTAQDLDTLLEAWLGLDRSVTIVDLSGVPPAVATDIVGSMTRVIYDAMFWARNFSEGSRERPVLFIFEEAHAYLGETRSAAAKSAVQRIVREGRKYGMGAMIVSQRPSEIDPTILSQCGTLIAMRLTNTADRAHVSAAAADNLKGILSMLPILRTGEAIILGESVPLPMRALITLPQSLPDSRDPAVVSGAMPGGWDRKREPSDYSLVVQAWRAQNQNSPSILKGKD
ncbi:MAG TPA: ATP-binding protein [Galbitalea sp.]|nr:ATP-binding protein [Galbitalea sp.]